jgi:hypothetical protein
MATIVVAKICTPKIVEYQLGSSDIIQSKAAKVVVSASPKVAAGAIACELAVSVRSLVESCSVLLRKSFNARKVQKAK